MHVAANGTTQSCVGINPEGPSWSSLFHELIKQSPEHCFDVDVSNWDGHMTPQLFFAVVAVFNRLYGVEPYSPSGLARLSLATSAVFGYDQWDDLVFKKCRGMPSGFAGTSIYNTIAHMIVFYVLYLVQCKRTSHVGYANFSTYLACVSVFFYGDDVVCSVSPMIADWFNSIEVAKLYSEFGWPATGAAKRGEIAPFTSIWEVQFLKRRFVIEPIKNFSLGTLVVHSVIDWSVIVNLLVWMRVNSRTIPDEQLYENINCAMQYCYSYGEETYEVLRSRINSILSQNGKKPFFVAFSTMRHCMLIERFGRVFV